MTFGIVVPKMSRLVTPLFGGGVKRVGRKPRQYRSIRRYVRGTYTSSANYAADVTGQKRPPVRHRKPKFSWT
jgi:hypothetical protein